MICKPFPKNMSIYVLFNDCHKIHLCAKRSPSDHQAIPKRCQILKRPTSTWKMVTKQRESCGQKMVTKQPPKWSSKSKFEKATKRRESCVPKMVTKQPKNGLLRANLKRFVRRVFYFPTKRIYVDTPNKRSKQRFV